MIGWVGCVLVRGRGFRGRMGWWVSFFSPFSLWRCGLAGMEYMSAGGACFVLSLFLFLLITRHHFCLSALALILRRLTAA